ncbi:MAG: isoprenyl transferase [Planctomycetaceae bacterium]|jgi:undecaprenyl diphosphate synthase|nr:isoprenyl transferase [Planctomycetaceae bacterium]
MELPEKMPKHIAVIMDGNGRWAQNQGLPRMEGHRRGAAVVREITEICCRWNLPQLTLYCFSSENWKRPDEELRFLMELLRHYMIEERSTLMKNNVKLQVIGRREKIPLETLNAMDETIEQTAKNTGMTLCLAVNYGSRQEITDAVRKIAADVLAGKISEEKIDETVISGYLYTKGMPDPDLLIRTAGEKRLSNYLLWQLSYAELWVTEKCWPEFNEVLLAEAVRAFAKRERRFGGLNRFT